MAEQIDDLHQGQFFNRPIGETAKAVAGNASQPVAQGIRVCHAHHHTMLMVPDRKNQRPRFQSPKGVQPGAISRFAIIGVVHQPIDLVTHRLVFPAETGFAPCHHPTVLSRCVSLREYRAGQSNAARCWGDRVCASHALSRATRWHEISALCASSVIRLNTAPSSRTSILLMLTPVF